MCNRPDDEVLGTGRIGLQLFQPLSDSHVASPLTAPLAKHVLKVHVGLPAVVLHVSPTCNAPGGAPAAWCAQFKSLTSRKTASLFPGMEVH